MQAKQLMINDWVQLMKLNKEIEYAQVEAIDKGGMITLSNGKTVGVDYLSPVTLTAEILVKNGFKARSNGISSLPHYKYREGNDEINVTLYTSSTEIEYLNIVPNYDDPDEVNYGHSFEIPRIISVHELQHIFALCDFIDITDNFKL